ncbi:cox cluster protein [Halapricum sp. CBA1109]|uniref:DUF6684 family protein n=1 Tax=Halapricum sp. CBA1109 TaxID=2668068 RepID=UPI0012F71BCF|nr:DUF6684 family protein [Halapricum sp. CBA1109]MUV88879.1 cox cluster protein [Halapricum sp. CBA1109]
MSSRTFDRDTILDLTVNVIPLAILGVFIVTFVLYSPGPFAFDSVASTLQLSIIGTTFVGLLALTYYMGKAVAGAEKRLGIHAETTTYDPETGSSIPGGHDEADEAELDADADDPELPDEE